MSDMKDEDKEVKEFLGMPMRWDRKNMFKGLWDPTDDRIFPPKYFGIGWTLNFHALLRQVGVIKESVEKDKGHK